MIFESFYSSSAGNLYRLTASDGSQLIIDPGVRWHKLIAALGYDLKKIVGCLISHSHKDHSIGASAIYDQGISVYAKKNTLTEIDLQEGQILHELERRIIGPFGVFPFEVQHDVTNYAYIITEGTDSLLFVIDCANIEHKFGVYFTEVAIGCSYDKDILRQRIEDNKINESLAKRLLTAHMEKSNVTKYLTECCNLSRCRRIHLLHMSRDNMNRKTIAHDIELALDEILGYQIEVIATAV